VLDVLFGDGYHELPKGLLPFHRYGSEIRTAFIEQIHEAADVTRGAGRHCRLHFTVAEVHQDLFESEWQRLRPIVEQAVGATVDVSFSVQAPETDAVAIDPRGALHREGSGRIAFRAGGHGALLVNLRRTSGDVVLIKNIDNIARRDVSARIAAIRARVCGALLLVERETHEAIRALRAGGKVAAAVQFLERQFGVLSSVAPRSESDAREVAMSLLNRPIRVCAMVPTSGHSGGRPFWVSEPERGQSLQIVEGAEVDLSKAEERALFHQTRHFNPVDMACSLRDVDGKPFDLSKYVDPSRALIAQKTVGGVALKAYEHPGLWNGGMALWNTVLVEVPEFAFNPVKSLADLASPGHRTLP
jgi:hypothetical protein